MPKCLTAVNENRPYKWVEWRGGRGGEERGGRGGQLMPKNLVPDPARPLATTIVIIR